MAPEFLLYPSMSAKEGWRWGAGPATPTFLPSRHTSCPLRRTSVLCELGAEATPPLANTVLLVSLIAKELRM